MKTKPDQSALKIKPIGYSSNSSLEISHTHNPLPRAPSSKGSLERNPQKNKGSMINRQKLLLSPGVTNMRISLDEDTVD